MPIQSKKKLAEALVEYAAETGRTVGLVANVYSFETYGRKTMAYIAFPYRTRRENAEEWLAARGWKVNFHYWPGSTCTEVQVSYFKAKGWDE